MTRRPKRRINWTGGPRLLAGWQRALLWAVWLAFVAAAWNNSDRGAFGATEFGVLAVAIAVTLVCCWYPLGIAKIVIREPIELRGEFESRTNWPWLLVSAFVLLGGIAMSIKLTRDLYYGFATFGDVIADVFEYWWQCMLEKLSGGLQGDVTKTRLYVLVVLVPIGLAMVAYNLVPLLCRGRPFRVDTDGSVKVWREAAWASLVLDDLASVRADGMTIDFCKSDGSELSLPQWRVFAREYQTPVAAHVLAAFFRGKLERANFRVEPSAANQRLQTAWQARQAGQQS